MKTQLKKNTKKLAIWTVAWVGSLAFLTGPFNKSCYWSWNDYRK